MSQPNKIPDFQSIMLPMLTLLKDGKTKSLNEMIKELTSYFMLTESDLLIKVPSGQMGLFKNRVAWTRSYLKNAGLIIYPSRGMYQITEYGKQFLETNPKELRLKQLKEMPKYKEWAKTFNSDSKSRETVGDNSKESQTPEEILGETIKTLNKQLATEILDKLKENSPEFFEDFVVKLLQKMGYGAFDEQSAQVTGKSGDNGIDGIIQQDRLGLESVYIQAKRFTSGAVGSPDIRNFIGSLAVQGVNKGVFLTTSSFSESAIKTAEQSKQQKIVLINGKRLTELAIEFNLGVQKNDEIEIPKKIDLDFFEEL